MKIFKSYVNTWHNIYYEYVYMRGNSFIYVK